MPQLLPMIMTAGTTATAGATAASTAASVVGLSSASALATAGATAAVKFSLSKFLISTAMSMALNALSMALMPKQTPQSAGISTDGVKMGSAVPRSFILGTYATSCHAIMPGYVFDIDKDDNKYLTLVYNISDSPIDSVIELWIDGRKYNTSPQVIPPNHFDDKLGMRIDGDDQRGWILYSNGYQTEAHPLLLELFSDYPERPFTSDMKMTGVSYLIATFKHLNADPKYTQIPDVRVVVKGKPLYDPRKDTTIGGSGPHRWGNEATYQYTDNPVVMAYNLFRGISMSPNEIYGVGAPASALPNSYWFAAMNVCDQAGTQPAGANYWNDKKRYSAGIEISVDKEPLDEIERILTSCGAVMAEIGGQYLITVGPPKMPSAHITDDEIIHDATSEFIITEGLNNIYNGVTARYPSPQAGWETEVATPLLNSAWEAEDMGHRLLASVDYSTVYSARQVRRLMREMASDNRRQRRHTIALPPTYLALNPTDTITWTSVSNGYSSKVFEVISTSIDPASLCVLVELRERDPNDYNYDDVEDAKTPSTPSGSTVYPINLGVKGFGAVGIALKDAAGKNRRSAIKLIWNPDVGYSSFNYELRVLGSTDVIKGTISDTSKGEALLQNVLPATTYQIRAIPAVAKNRKISWGAWINVTTPAVFIGSDDFADGVTGLFEDAGIKATREIANRTVAGAYDGELAWSRADNALYMWDAASSSWKPFIERDLNNILESTMVAQKLATIKVVTALPANGTLNQQVSFNGKIYRWNGTKWTAEVQAIEITGLLTDEQIADIAAAKISGEITYTQIANNAVRAEQLADNAVSSLKIANNAITSAKIVAGAIGAEQIAAYAITAKHLVVSDFTNLITNSTMENADGWDISHPGVTWTSDVPTNASQPGNLMITNTTNIVYASWAQPAFIPCAADDEFWVGASFRASGTTPIATPRLSISYYDKNKALISSTAKGFDTLNSTDYTNIGWGFPPAPAGTAYAGFNFGRTGNKAGESGSLYIEAPFVRRKNNADLIVDGTITGNKVAANTITGNLLTVDAITAREIKANTITASHLTADSITARELKANTITASHMTVDSINSAAISAGAVGADQIAAGSIVASKLAISDYTNLVPDSELQDVAGWTGVPNNGSGIIQLRSTSGSSWVKTEGDLFYSNSRNTNNVNVNAISGFIPVTVGDVLYIAGQMNRVGGTKMRGQIDVVFYDKNKTSLNNVIIYSVNGTATSTAIKSAEATVPTNAYFVRWRFYVYGANTDSNIVVGSPTIRFKNKGELIVDGTIKGTHIEAGTITGGLLSATGIISKSGQIDDLVVKNQHIENLTIEALKIGANALYVPYLFSRADVEVPNTRTSTNQILLFNRTIPDFEGGGYLVAFHAMYDSTVLGNAFGLVRLVIDGVQVSSSKFGVRGYSSLTESSFPIVLLGSSSGTGTTNIKVYVHNSRWDDENDGVSTTFHLRNINLTVTGSRR